MVRREFILLLTKRSTIEVLGQSFYQLGPTYYLASAHFLLGNFCYMDGKEKPSISMII